MPSFNSVTLVGHLTRDIELRYTPKGAAVGQMGLAINRTWVDESGTKKEAVTWVDVTIWGKTAENCAQYLKKGRPVLISGRLESQEWADKTTGQKRQRLGVVAERVQFLGGRDDSAPQARLGTRPTGTPASSAVLSPPVEGDGPPESDSVPF